MRSWKLRSTGFLRHYRRPYGPWIELKHRCKYRLILDETFSFGTIGRTGRGSRQPGQRPWVPQSHYLHYAHVLVFLFLVVRLFTSYLQSASPHPWNEAFALSMDDAYNRESISPMCTSVERVNLSIS